MQAEFFEKETIVEGQTFKLFSLDRWRWSTDKNEIAECERRREKLLAEMARSIKRTAAFSHQTRRQVRE